MANLARLPQALREVDTFSVFTDFTEDQTDLLWIDTVTDSGSVAMGDAVGGQAVLTPSDCSVSDNDEAYIRSANEIFLLAAGKPMYAECRLKYAETVASTQNIGFFFQNAIGADSIIDTAGGLKVSGSTLGIYKAETAVWKVVSANNGTSTVNTTSFTAAANTWYTLAIDVQDRDSLNCVVTYYINGLRLRDSTTGAPIEHVVAYASATEMNLGAGVKLGAATNNDALTIDYIGGCQAR